MFVIKERIYAHPVPYYVAASFDPELGSSWGHDTKYQYVQKLNTARWSSPHFYIKNTLKYLKSVEW